MTATMKAKNTTMSTELTMENQWTCFERQRGGARAVCECECEGNKRARAGGWVASGGRACRTRAVERGWCGRDEVRHKHRPGQHSDGGSGMQTLSGTAWFIGALDSSLDRVLDRGLDREGSTLSGTAWFMDRYTSQRDAHSTSLARHSTP